MKNFEWTLLERAGDLSRTNVRFRFHWPLHHIARVTLSPPREKGDKSPKGRLFISDCRRTFRQIWHHTYTHTHTSLGSDRRKLGINTFPRRNLILRHTKGHIYLLCEWRGWCSVWIKNDRKVWSLFSYNTKKENSTKRVLFLLLLSIVGKSKISLSPFANVLVGLVGRASAYSWPRRLISSSRTICIPRAGVG